MRCPELKVPVYASAIARKLATVHSLNVPIDKEPTWLWDTLYKWLDSVRNLSQDESSEQQSPNPAIEEELCSFDFESEINWLKPFLKSCKCPTVFCHNDLQEGNILLPESSSIKYSDDTIVFIDFEFCAYNYRGFDFGNHFVERMFDYSNPEWPHYYAYMDEYPSDDDKRLFVREYINKAKKLPSLSNQRATEDQLIKEADCFALGSHMLWTLWSINNARTSKIKFGYWVRIHSFP